MTRSFRQTILQEANDVSDKRLVSLDQVTTVISEVLAFVRSTDIMEIIRGVDFEYDS